MLLILSCRYVAFIFMTALVAKITFKDQETKSKSKDLDIRHEITLNQHLAWCSWNADSAAGDRSISLSIPATYVASSLSNARFNKSQLRDLMRSKPLQPSSWLRHSFASFEVGDVTKS